MKKLIAVLLVLLVVSASFTFACEHTQNSTKCDYCVGLTCAAGVGTTTAVMGMKSGGAAAVAGGLAGAAYGFADGYSDGKCDGKVTIGNDEESYMDYEDDSGDYGYWDE